MTEKKKSKNLFWKAFAILLCFLIVVICILLNLGYKVMMDYDETQSFPKKKSGEIAELISEGNYDLIFMDEKPNAYLFQKDEYYAYISKLISENGCTAVRGFSEDRYNHPVYDIKAGKTTLAKVEFEKNPEKSEYGFDSYSYLKTTPGNHGSYSIRVLVPENATLKLFGEEVSSKYKTGKSETISLQGNTLFLNETSEPLKEMVYDYYYVEDLLTEPSPEIIYNDTGLPATLRYSKDYNAFTIDTFHITVTAPSNYKVYVNDMLVSADNRFVIKSGEEVSDINQIAAGLVTTLVTMVTYEVNDLRYEDGNVVKVLDFEGIERARNEEYSTKQHYDYDVGITPKSLEYFGTSEEILIERAEGYSRFINDDGDRKETILPYVYKNAQIYKDFEEFWVVFSAHLEYWFENELLEQVVFYQDDLFFADVSFDYWIKGFDHKTDNTKSYDTFVRFWYVKVNGEWKIVDYSLTR